MERKIRILLIVMLILSLAAAPALAQKNTIMYGIQNKNREANDLKNSMMTTDQVLSSRQQQVNAMEDRSLTYDVNGIKSDLSSATNAIPAWENKIMELEKSYLDLERQSARSQLSPADKADVRHNLNDLRNNINDLNLRLESISNKAAYLRDRVK